MHLQLSQAHTEDTEQSSPIKLWLCVGPKIQSDGQYFSTLVEIVERTQTSKSRSLPHETAWTSLKHDFLICPREKFLAALQVFVKCPTSRRLQNHQKVGGGKEGGFFEIILFVKQPKTDQNGQNGWKKIIDLGRSFIASLNLKGGGCKVPIWGFNSLSSLPLRTSPSDAHRWGAVRPSKAGRIQTQKPGMPTEWYQGGEKTLAVDPDRSPVFLFSPLDKCGKWDSERFSSL